MSVNPFLFEINFKKYSEVWDETVRFTRYKVTLVLPTPHSFFLVLVLVWRMLMNKVNTNYNMHIVHIIKPVGSPNFTKTL